MLEIHFLNVGHGDCTVIKHPSGRITVIDICNGEKIDAETTTELIQSIRKAKGPLGAVGLKGAAMLREAGCMPDLTNPVEYIQRIGPSIWRFVLTHPDMDHMRGIDALAKTVQIHNFWDTGHNKELVEFVRDGDQADWARYKAIRSGTDSAKVLKLLRGAKNKYFNQDDSGGSGDNIQILAPSEELKADANQSDEANRHSYVLWMSYENIRIILGGDADAVVWEDLNKRFILKCDILKASHHGRDSGYHQPAVESMSPKFTIVSVGKKPETDASNKYKQYTSQEVLSTRFCGNIVFKIHPGGRIEYETQAQMRDLQNYRVGLASLLGNRVYRGSFFH